MRNLSMQRKLDRGEAIDVAKMEQTADGFYVLPSGVVEGMDYCDSEKEHWVWSIGRNLETGQVVASLTNELYLNNKFECVWLR
jgi:hypothetical protein